MSSSLKDFLKRWLINTVAVLVATHVVKGISYDREDWLSLLLATLVLGILNTFIRPILMLLSLPLLIVTLGLFTIVINALLLYLVGALFTTFDVDSFGAALLGAIVISIISFLLNVVTGSGKTRIEIKTHRVRSGRRGKRRDDDDGGNGPVIDV
jgi:putative membrane protein